MSLEARVQWLFNTLGVTVPPRTAAAPGGPPPPSDGAAQQSNANDDGATRPSEIVAGASGVQYSTGENTDQATRGNQDFAQGSRDAAQANQQGTGGPSNPMQSPNLAQGAFVLRYGIGFLCSTYPAGWNNLADIAGYSTPNSAFLHAFTGLSRTQQYTNPTKATIVSQINTWIGTLAHDLAATSGQGELVLTFQGHGAHGSFYASDGQELTTSELMGMARQAERQRVSLTIVMDACFSGGAVPAFQQHAADSVDTRVDQHVEGRGNQSSPDNHASAEALRDEMAQARELINFSAAIARHGDTLNTIRQPFGTPPSPQQIQAALAENTTVLGLIRQMKRQFDTNMPFDHAPRALHDAVTGAFQTVDRFLAAFNPSTEADLDNWMNAIGLFNHQIGESANQILRAVQGASAPS